MLILNLSTLKVNDDHSYYGGAIGNIAYNLLSHLAKIDGVEVVSSVKGTRINGNLPEDLKLIEVNGILELWRFAKQWLPQSDVATHLYFHEPEWSPIFKLPKKMDVPFIIGMCEAPHVRFSDEVGGLEKIKFIRKPGKRLYSKLTEFTLQAADDVVFVTPHANNYYQKYMEVGGHVVPYGVDTNRFTPSSQPDQHRILVVSRVIRRRGIQHLLLALPDIVQEVGGVNIDIVGTGEFENALIPIFQDVDFVKFHGNVSPDKLAGLYRSCSLFCHLSFDDGWNQPALEAMASGKPVVVTDKPHNPMVVGGGNGFRVQWRDTNEIAKSISLLLERKEVAQAFGRAGRRMVEQHYTWNNIAKQYIQIISESLISNA